jgi:hypothetical protein
MRSLLWIDCSAGFLVGAFVLTLAPWLSELYALPLPFVRAMGVANVAYGCYSFSLARQAVRPPALITALVIANASWAVLCVVVAVLMASRASIIGLAQLLLEGVLVGGLAALEWKHRALLVGAAEPS